MSWLPGTNIPTWSIKVSQHSCSDWWKAPTDCTQYFTGETGTLKTYNYDSGVHLANQDYNICIRTERKMCTIYYAQTGPATFKMSGTIAGSGNIQSSWCSEDYITIPGGQNPALPIAPPTATRINRFCGGMLQHKLVGTTAVTISTVITPFRIGVVTDGGESDSYSTPPATYKQSLSTGFKIHYKQLNCA